MSAIQCISANSIFFLFILQYVGMLSYEGAQSGPELICSQGRRIEMHRVIQRAFDNILATLLSRRRRAKY